jgi:hypothetical protein
MTKEASKIRVSKLNAACRQLRTAIALWFTDGDPVSTHMLAFAAYEVLHALSKKRDPNRRDLLFDSDLVKDEYRKDWLAVVKREANFFKHADRDGDSVIEFNPSVTEYFLLYASLARQLCGEPQSEEESTFLWWFQIHNADLLTDKGRAALNRLPTQNLEEVRQWPKRQFFEVMHQARRVGGRRFGVDLSLS